MKFSNLRNPCILMIFSLSFLQAAEAQIPVSQASQLSQEVATLRKQGTKGLQVFLKSHSSKLNNPQVRKALDALCQQRDCYASRLYWYTDIEQAKAAAQASGKPILSLRLLGRLDQDLSCANSRFFRVALYPNAEISHLLQDRFILHWESVRPVPKVTIDFGDGRKLERTITGNSIHHILDGSGRPIDAIPGLYSPKAFLQQLQQAELLSQEYRRIPVANRDAFLKKYHSDRLQAIQTQWTADLSQLGINSFPRLTQSPSNTSQPPTAELAASLAVSKMAVERPLLRTIQPTNNRETLAKITDEESWNKIAQLYIADTKLDQNSVALIRAKTKAANLQKLVKNFESVMALDTVRNEYILHSQIHQWFVEGNQTSDVAILNDKVYAQLFLTPNSDPWLGLAPDGIYNAIDNDGMR
ncbi:hypothetical protein ACN23B_12825 [Anabaena sp. FACHB-709]|nr:MULTISPECIES: hypothetical protein [Nostocaceae]HBW29916.1 hypothetical protein [Nostoc sp. UBA8866]MBD2169740.1 hypothetical protein [Anabaena cylindrica FACHB-318]MBD2261841.1 hypothetical protein [Anabaena sp. FACHB-709]MBD2271426.1 hypothetical protein [Nostoc sp. PCC 7120 = FACHB-418]MBD2282304.1 hypothetical protein [Anabaena cylindrica FACHB-170]